MELQGRATPHALYLRPLGPLERFFWRYSERNPTHFLVVAEFDEEIRAHQVRAALDAVQERHPLLSAHVRQGRDRSLTFYRAAGVAPIDLTIHPKSVRDWQSVAVTELAEPFTREAEPLIRATLLNQEKQSALLLTFDHSIADGISSVVVLNDVLAAINGETLAPLPVPMPQEDLVRGTLAGALHSEVPGRDDDPRLTVPVSVRPFESTYPHVHGVELSTDDTTRLVTRCREERTTVHGAIVAAASRIRGLESGEEYVRTYSPINIRELIANGSDCCLRIGSACTGMATDDGADFWTQAREVSATLNVARSAPAVVTGTAMVEQHSPIDSDCEAAERFFCTTLPFELLITNLGARRFTARGPVRPKAVWGPIVLAQIEREHVIGIITYGGQLRMVCCGHAPTADFLRSVQQTLMHASR